MRNETCDALLAAPEVRRERCPNGLRPHRQPHAQLQREHPGRALGRPATPASPRIVSCCRLSSSLACGLRSLHLSSRVSQELCGCRSGWSPGIGPSWIIPIRVVEAHPRAPQPAARERFTMRASPAPGKTLSSVLRSAAWLGLGSLSRCGAALHRDYANADRIDAAGLLAPCCQARGGGNPAELTAANLRGRGRDHRVYRWKTNRSAHFC